MKHLTVNKEKEHAFAHIHQYAKRAEKKLKKEFSPIIKHTKEPTHNTHNTQSTTKK